LQDLSPAISSEARDLLVQRLELVTDVQWLTAFKIGRIEELLGITSNDWLTTLKKKIEQMKTASCLPFDTHTSSLASP
jgi:hypothetical protein